MEGRSECNKPCEGNIYLLLTSTSRACPEHHRSASGMEHANAPNKMYGKPTCKSVMLFVFSCEQRCCGYPQPALPAAVAHGPGRTQTQLLQVAACLEQK